MHTNTEYCVTDPTDRTFTLTVSQPTPRLPTYPYTTQITSASLGNAIDNTRLLSVYYLL